MIIRRTPGAFANGYTPIAQEQGDHSDMLMDFGILRMDQGGTHLNSEPKERAFLVMMGHFRFEWGEEHSREVTECSRQSLLDEGPVVLHVPADVPVTIKALNSAGEIAYQARSNSASFRSRVWKPGDYRSDRFGEGTMQETCTRTVRTVFDAATAPRSAMVLGEVVNHPGKWSSYPPHDHPQPEIYHYRFFPDSGFGFSAEEETVSIVRDRDTAAIPPGVTHPQCAAPGYAMYYIWAIPHLPGQKFGPDSREFRQQHSWLLEQGAPIWPDAPVE